MTLADVNEDPIAQIIVRRDGPALEMGDSNGKLRAPIAVGKDGPALTLIDENGQSRAGMSVNADGSSLVLTDKASKNRAGITVTKDGPWLEIQGETKQIAMCAGNDNAGLVVGCAKDQRLVSISTNEIGTGIRICDETGNLRVELGLGKANQRLVLCDKTGKPVWYAP